MSKHSGENTLLQVFKNIKAQVDSLKNTIDSKQEPFIVTATADFVNGVMLNVSHTFVQIEEAYNRGDHIFVEVDISQMTNGQKTLLNLSNYNNSAGVFMFEQTMRREPDVIFITAVLSASGANSFSIKTLAQQTQLGGLTLVTSNTAPTVDDRSIITFVVEE